MFSTVKKIHFVGIGGIGMSGIAEILIDQGFSVSGSDLSTNENTQYLENLGATIFYGHQASNIQDAEVVVYSSAVKVEENAEVQEALARRIPILKRSEMLAEVSRMKYTLAISGTHGKTTTTSMVGLIMIEAELDPTIIVGGRLKDFGGTNARLGNGEWIVVEADEYDRSFLQLTPTIAIVNNIEEEHMDIYEDIDDLHNTFIKFANKVPFYGFVAVCIDEPGVKEIITNINKKIVTYGLSKNADIRAKNILQKARNSEFDLFINNEFADKVVINVPGLHNIKNSLAAITVALQIGVDIKTIVKALSQFSGVYRRFDIKGEVDGIMVVDDYAHHPSEIKATLDAAKNGWDKRIVAVFQPHTFTRTQKFYKEFARSFDDADLLIITDVYPARELPIEGINGELIANYARKYGHKNVVYIQNYEDILDYLKSKIKPNDIVITIGAGSIVKIADKLFEHLSTSKK